LLPLPDLHVKQRPDLRKLQHHGARILATQELASDRTLYDTHPLTYLGGITLAGILIHPLNQCAASGTPRASYSGRGDDPVAGLDTDVPV